MKILLAEDDRNLGIVIKSELEDDNYTVDLVSDGVEAVLHFLDTAYDIVLMDIRMPKLDGISALKIIKKINPGVPAITFTGNKGQHEQEETVTAGAIVCLSKPFEIYRLKDYLKTCVMSPQNTFI